MSEEFKDYDEFTAHPEMNELIDIASQWYESARQRDIELAGASITRLHQRANELCQPEPGEDSLEAEQKAAEWLVRALKVAVNSKDSAETAVVSDFEIPGGTDE